MKKMEYYVSEVFKKYTVFTGRARRSEYWYFFLFNIVAGLILGYISVVIGDKTDIISRLFNAIVFVPSITVGIRRLHDIGKSGWWMLLCLIPIIGWIWLIVLLATDSTPGENIYGLNPKETEKK